MKYDTLIYPHATIFTKERKELIKTMNKKWQYIENNKERAKEISEKFNITPLIAQIIANKNLSDEKVKIFLDPTRNNFYDPFLLPDMEKAVERILKAIENKEKVLIYGDYDVDGITSTTVLMNFLEERGLKVQYYIPNRLKEGYGLNKEAIKQIVDEKINLMITVDCRNIRHRRCRICE